MMRAKFRVDNVEPYRNDEGEVTQETLYFRAVAKEDGYDNTGDDENNTYAKWSPSATCEITVANPALWGKFEAGQEYYVDFTLAKEAKKEE